ncbi:ORF6N domain-containing protein [Aliarcobacter butzleri]|uniref:ORF6N domain-containing protein n=1 Tax=Aliarcobacter butzleri TaxID=28197 RepID=UPI001EDBE436|nr:ORF6N domain-containing protein [Aliarcobacter butzleri]MCG3706963.1 ORF6N domain-containing protein [Aliarcobacter butzleri]MCT7585965.1 ORF6N domain-containing protein [Aliarcobacter butzleri]MDN5061162.1 ORF6N domain-containing protein [Aliarcobacter butzleri]MDN5126723.1 ORF6N domain-containing protein [Aliarcobacter butzleri]
MQDLIINENNIKDKIHTIRNLQVMLDRDLAELYGVETKVFNQAVKRNIKRFPKNYRFQLTENEKNQLVTNCDWLNSLKHSSSLPYVFTEQGVSMLSSILKSDKAINISIKIIDSFVSMRKLISQNIPMFERFERIEQRLTIHDENFDKLFEALEDKTLKTKQGIFYNGEIFDAYVFINNLLKLATNEIILIDNYVDETVFTLFSKYPNIKIKIYTSNITKQLKLDFKKYQTQYKNIELFEFKNSHDRFLILDKKEIYHLGASLKDLGKKWFAFSKFEIENLKILDYLK